VLVIVRLLFDGVGTQAILRLKDAIVLPAALHGIMEPRVTLHRRRPTLGPLSDDGASMGIVLTEAPTHLTATRPTCCRGNEDRSGNISRTSTRRWP
jgi:hypothetical protein